MKRHLGSLGSLGSHHWLEWGSIMHLQGALPSWQMCQAYMTSMSEEDQFEVLSLWECWWGLRKEYLKLLWFHFLSFIQGLLERRYKHFWKACWDQLADELMPSVYIFWTLEFLRVSNETSAIVMLLGTSVFFASWRVPESEKKPASSPAPRTPLFPVPCVSCR